jgi:competence protein ComEC
LWRGFSLAWARDWLRGNAIAESERWVLWLPVAMGGGIAIYFALSFEPSPVLAWPFLTSAIFLGGFAATSEGLLSRFVFGFVAAALIGFSLAQLRTASVAAPVLPHKIGPVDIDGRVQTVEPHERNVRVEMIPSSIGHMHAETLPAMVRVSIRSGADNLRPGDEISVRAVLMPPPAPAEPGDYDFGRSAYYLRLGAVGYAFGEPEMMQTIAQKGWRPRLENAVENLRWRMTQHIESELPGSIGGIAAALVTGDRGAINDGDEQSLRDAGLAHVLAIAGLHMALVGLGLFWVVRALLAAIPTLALNYPIKKWAAIAALCGTTFYLIVSGAAVPATRAYVMLTTMLVAILFDRPALSMRSVALAAAIILFLRPESIIQPGFQMSFAAVVSLVAVAEWERTRPQLETGPNRFAEIRRYMRGIAMTSFIGSLATAPFAAFHFERATHYAVLGNLLAMPIMGFVAMPAAAISVLLMPLHLDHVPLQIMGWGIEAMLAVGRQVSALPGSVSVVSAWPLSAIVFISLGGLWMTLWRRNWRWLGALPIVIGVALIFDARQPDILISRDGATVAVRGHDGLLRLMGPPSDNYSAQEWLKRDGDARDISIIVATSADGVRCDWKGCIGRLPDDSLIASAARTSALAEDCNEAAIVVSASPVRGTCKGPKLVVDRFAVADNGAYAIWLDGNNMRVETVRQDRGDRPWSPPPRKSQYRRISPTSLP